MDKELFVTSFYNIARQAGEKFNINPVVILAQGAFEGAWGSSNLVQKSNNHFGIRASGKTNDYWNGSFVTTNTNGKFRKYNSAKDSFFDFARLISSSYKDAAAVSNNYKSYAKKIAYSPYIVDSDGREKYAANVQNNAFLIEEIVKKKGLIKTATFGILPAIGLGLLLAVLTNYKKNSNNE